MSAPSTACANPDPSRDDDAFAFFERGCVGAGVAGEDVAALWRLHAGTASTKSWSLEDLLAEHAEWTMYRLSRAGDAAAARDFERRWKAYVAAFHRGRGTRDDVEELTARFFERVYRLVDGAFRWQCPFTVYLRAVLVNLARDAWEREARRRQRESGLEEILKQLPFAGTSAQRSPEDCVLAEEKARAVQRAVGRLSETDRAILHAVVMDGKSGQELAAMLGMTRQAAYQRIHRVKGRLRALLQEGGFAAPRRRSRDGAADAIQGEP